MAGEKARINYKRSFDSTAFDEVLRVRLRAIGVSESIIPFFASHCMKRGSIPLMLKLGLCDADIMLRIGMSGERAFLNYVESFDSFTTSLLLGTETFPPLDLTPRFAMKSVERI